MVPVDVEVTVRVPVLVVLLLTDAALDMVSCIVASEERETDAKELEDPDELELSDIEPDREREGVQGVVNETVNESYADALEDMQLETEDVARADSVIVPVTSGEIEANDDPLADTEREDKADLDVDGACVTVSERRGEGESLVIIVND